MMVLISYDVKTTSEGGSTRLRRVAKACKDHGQRVQFSVFEAELDPDQWVLLKQRLIDAIDESCDSLRFYYLGRQWQNRIEHIGAKPSLDMHGPLIF